ncbi:unnamed protein product [Tetraodon nigroviridis]|uniref:(spotted green pufferfish) hypothetical protein n=1 Tax=Tetraodon nigroviridis TaxID=99883 RepID=Q4SIN9_TETNG|nr:unnamed protein product [Tetraodon nigroviridis]
MDCLPAGQSTGGFESGWPFTHGPQDGQHHAGEPKMYPFMIKLIDFGLAEEMSRVVPGSEVQPLWYRAPEVLLGLPLTEAIDIWSLGCLAAQLYLGRQLYHTSSESEMVFPVTDKEKLDLVLLLDLLVKTLHLEPAKRITPQKILKHGFVTSFTAIIAGVWKSSVVKSTSSSPKSGEPAKKSPDPQRPTTEVQPKPPRTKRKRKDDHLPVSKCVKNPNFW